MLVIMIVNWLLSHYLAFFFCWLIFPTKCLRCEKMRQARAQSISENFTFVWSQKRFFFVNFVFVSLLLLACFTNTNFGLLSVATFRDSLKIANFYQITTKHITDCVPNKDSSRVDLMTSISDTVPVAHKFYFFIFFFSQFSRDSKMHRKIRMHTPTSMAVLQLNTWICNVAI